MRQHAGAVVLNISFQGKKFKCCNKESGKNEMWASAQGSVELFYQVGYSRKPKPGRVPGRDRNKRVPHPCKAGETVKMKNHYLALLECQKRKAGGGAGGGAGLFIPSDCPTEETLQFSGKLFVRGTAGVGFGVSANLDYNVNPNSPLSWSNFGGGVDAGWVGYGASVDAGGSASGEYIWKL